MSKRELEKLASVSDIDAPRAKRRKDASTTGQSDKQDTQGTQNVAVIEDTADEKEAEMDTEKMEVVQEQALKLWQTVKDAMDKECVTTRAACNRSSTTAIRSPYLFFLLILIVAARCPQISTVYPLSAYTLTTISLSRSLSRLTRSSPRSTLIYIFLWTPSNKTSKRVSGMPSDIIPRKVRSGRMPRLCMYVAFLS